MTDTIGPVEVSCPLWSVVYDGTGGAKNGVVLPAGGAPAIICVAATAPEVGAPGIPVPPTGVAVAVGENEILWGRAYGTTDNDAVAAVVFSPSA